MGCFCYLAIVDIVTDNTGVQISVQVPPFCSFGFIARSGIAGSYDNCVSNVLRNHHNALLEVHFSVIFASYDSSGI